jgi:hypothetical protein
MGATAQFKEFGPFFLNGALVTAPHIFHYLVGTTTLKDAYADRGKLATVAQPLVGDANGLASAYWDGLYKIIVKTSDEATILATWDSMDLTEAEHRLEGSLVWNPGNLADGAGETSSGITVADAAFGDFVDVAAPYDLQGITATAYVSASNTVKIRVQNETGGAIDLASGTWKVRVRQQ